MPLEKRRERVAQAWNLTNEVVLVQAGDEIPVPGGQDQRYAFRPHTDYLYLTEDKTPNGVLAFDPHEGWTHFLPAITWEDQLWTGAEPREEANLDGLRWWLEQRADRPGKRSWPRTSSTTPCCLRVCSESCRVTCRSSWPRKPSRDVAVRRPWQGL